MKTQSVHSTAFPDGTLHLWYGAMPKPEPTELGPIMKAAAKKRAIELLTLNQVRKGGVNYRDETAEEHLERVGLK